MASEEHIIIDNVSDFSGKEQEHAVHENGEPSNQSQSQSSSYFETINSQLLEDLQYSNPYQNTGSDSTNNLYECMIFESKHAAVNAIKQFHFLHLFNFDVVDNKSDKYVVKCNQYGNACYWRVRASFNKIRMRWEIKKINGFTLAQLLSYHKIMLG